MSCDRVLYWGPMAANALRVKLSLEFKGLAYEDKLVNHRSEEGKAELLTLNPRGQIPILKDGDVVVCESLAAIMYIESVYPNPPLLPADPILKAKALQRMMESVPTIETFHKYTIPKIRGLEIPNEDAVIEELKVELKRWDGYYSEHKYLAGDELTVADMAIIPGTMVYARWGMTFKDNPNLKGYYERIKEHPAVIKMIPQYWNDAPPEFDIFKIF